MSVHVLGLWMRKNMVLTLSTILKVNLSGALSNSFSIAKISLIVCTSGYKCIVLCILRTSPSDYERIQYMDDCLRAHVKTRVSFAYAQTFTTASSSSEPPTQTTSTITTFSIHETHVPFDFSLTTSPTWLPHQPRSRRIKRMRKCYAFITNSSTRPR